MSRNILIQTFLSAILSCSFSFAQQRILIANTPYPVSIIKILANPDFYHGKKVYIKGYIHNKVENSALYYTKDHADRLMSFDAVWIRYKSNLSDSLKIDLQTFDEKYVGIMGVFNKNELGHMGSFAGAVEQVSSIRELVDYSGKTNRKKK